MTTRPIGPVFDADHHLYETQDCFTRYLPREHRDVVRYVQVNGRTKIVIRNVLTNFIPNPTFEMVARPGSTMAYYSGKNPEGKTMREMMGEPMAAIPAFRDPQARLAVLDEQGSAAALMFPTLASLMEVSFLDEPDTTMQLIRAYNRWLLDDWTFNYQDRIFATPIVNPSIVDEAIRDLEFLLDNGAKAVLLRPGPVAGSPRTRSPFLPEFDPFWARVQEAGILVTVHASDSGYNRYVNDWEGADLQYQGFRPNPFQIASMGSRPIVDTMLSAICHGMLSRFPGVKLFSVENGAAFVPQVLSLLDSTYKKIPQDFAEHPREVFRRNIWVNPFWEDSIDDLVAMIGADRVCFGSDWPHPEGLADPVGYIDELGNLSDDDARRIMGGNLYELLGLPIPAAVEVTSPAAV